MAQTEDTELRDLVVESLEKNGSLAKIRALLRANIFLAFEDDYENIKQNLALDNILKLPEGILSLSIVYEFLEFCNLKNTLFVYKSESRNEKEYQYEGQKSILDKLNLRRDSNKEPILVSLLKVISKTSQRHYNADRKNLYTHGKPDNDLNKDDQNCTYIVHEDSSSTSNSHSDNSSDEKTKLHLRLPLDNSDTDTSSDSTRDKSSSEYIPNEHIVVAADKKSVPNQAIDNVASENLKNITVHSNKSNLPYFLSELKIVTSSSSDSTSYVELKPFNLSDEKLLNTTGIPMAPDEKSIYTSPPRTQDNMASSENIKNSQDHKKDASPTINSMASLLLNQNDSNKENDSDKKSEKMSKSDSETAEYSYDFTLSGASRKDMGDVQVPSSQYVQNNVTSENGNKNVPILDSPHERSQSSQSSISISDVADLISEKSFSVAHSNNENDNLKSKSQNSNKSPRSNKSPHNDSGDFSESPVPSLSNLSLDIHSD
ncbi:dentin sialophosphoprotein-like [Ostrinia furnacalis]|uniref:dentin sialophosphoprotein-like n=1 Tax=Ostrinia furnacalis TaxID=93504 RepID=UPI00103C5B2F|nr:dentin sialophosphoprotein-like [Ostrinia furnacalis]